MHQTGFEDKTEGDWNQTSCRRCRSESAHAHVRRLVQHDALECGTVAYQSERLHAEGSLDACKANHSGVLESRRCADHQRKDSTNTQELRFGDNDNLAALTAVQLGADGLFLFTDVDYLYTANPRSDPSAKPLRVVREPWSLQVDTTSEGSGLGTGGMETKIAAARTVSTAGIPCGLINGQHPGRIHSFLEFGILQNKSPDEQASMPEGTFFMAMQEAQNVNDTERWILSLPTPGELEVDEKAARALAEHGSLKPVSITQCQGSFTRDEAAKIMHRGSEIGRAIMNFDSDELNRLKGRQSNDFLDILGYAACSEACHQSSVILTTDPEALRELGQGNDNLEALRA